MWTNLLFMYKSMHCLVAGNYLGRPRCTHNECAGLFRSCITPTVIWLLLPFIRGEGSRANLYGLTTCDGSRVTDLIIAADARCVSPAQGAREPFCGCRDA